MLIWYEAFQLSTTVSMQSFRIDHDFLACVFINVFKYECEQSSILNVCAELEVAYFSFEGLQLSVGCFSVRAIFFK